MRYSQIMNTYRRGLFAEFVARTHLRLHGFRILKSRYTTGRNTNRAEIDIIAQRGGLIVFIEVKAHQSDTSAWDAIDTRQSARLRRAAETYLGKRGWRGDARFDVMMVHGLRVKWIRGAI